VSPRTFAPPPGWAPDGHRIKAPLDDGRGPDKVWVYGALRERDGRAVTVTAPARNTAGYLRLLAAVERANPAGERCLIADNLSSHKRPPIQAWLDAHARVHQVFIPKGACWLNLQEGWWRLFRKEALAGQRFADAPEIAYATAVATRHLNRRATPWSWGRPPPRYASAAANWVTPKDWNHVFLRTSALSGGHAAGARVTRSPRRSSCWAWRRAARCGSCRAR
jgi:hypothetical protein